MAKPPQQRPEQMSDHELVYEFVTAVSYLLMSDEFKGTALYKFLIRFARQWHIPNVDLDEVIVEAVTRGIAYIRNHNQPIKKPEAWLRQVCLNILKNRVDGAIKDERKVTALTTLAHPAKSPLVESELIEQLEYLEVALNQLSKEDQSLIRMKFLHRKTYEQIRHHYKLMAQGDSVPTVQALRKRESRALMRLRETFLKLYEGDPSQAP